MGAAQMTGTSRDQAWETASHWLRQAITGLVTGEDWARAMGAAAHLRSRSFTDALLVHTQHTARYHAGTVVAPVARCVAGWRDWERLGRRVAPGQSGNVVIGPLTVPPGGAGPVAGTVDVGWVWDVSQTVGPPIVTGERPLLDQGVRPAGLWSALVDIAQQVGYGWQYTDRVFLAGRVARTDHRTWTIGVDPHVDDATSLLALAHEVAHLVCHDPTDTEAWTHQGTGEIEAASVAAIIGAAHAMPTNQLHFPDVATWATVPGPARARAILGVGTTARNIAVDLLGRVNTFQTGGGTPPGLDLDASDPARPPAAPAPAHTLTAGTTSPGVSDAGLGLGR
jgi:hypothetical protein